MSNCPGAHSLLPFDPGGLATFDALPERTVTGRVAEARLPETENEPSLSGSGAIPCGGSLPIVVATRPDFATIADAAIGKIPRA